MRLVRINTKQYLGFKILATVPLKDNVVLARSQTNRYSHARYSLLYSHSLALLRLSITEMLDREMLEQCPRVLVFSISKTLDR